MIRSSIVPCALFTLGLAAPALASEEHGGDIIVGRTGPDALTANTLAIEADLDEPVFLSPVSGLFNGWTSDEPGFDALASDEPAESFYTLASGAAILLEIVAIDSGFAVVEAGGGTIADAVGESITLGGSDLHSHPTWYAQSSVLGDGWTGTLNATFRLVDTGTTGYNESEPFSLAFTNVPEPASLALLGIGGTLVAMRRRGGTR